MKRRGLVRTRSGRTQGFGFTGGTFGRLKDTPRRGCLQIHGVLATLDFTLFHLLALGYQGTGLLV